MRTPQCEQIRDDIAALLEGDLPEALREHLVDCDECRDLRHEARRIAEHVAHAGADFVATPEFEARLLAAIDAHDVSEAGARTTQPTGTPIAASFRLPDSSPTVASAESASTGSAAFAASSTSPKSSPIAATRAMERPPTPLSPSPVIDARARFARRRAMFIAVGALAAAAASVPFFLHNTRPTHSASSTTTSPTVAARNPWHGTLATVASAGGGGATSVQMRIASATEFQPLARGAEIPAGAEVRTDGRTRARIDLADGSQLVLDRSTNLTFDLALPRAATLAQGAVVADVAHLDDVPNARVALPNGGVTVVGTKFLLTASDGRSTVRVTRGLVRLADQGGHEVEVKIGEEGVLAGGAPEVSPAVDLANAVAWSELNGEVRTDPEAPIVGLGELRARRPGQTNEQAQAVALRRHSVRVRIAGNMARTEVEETFRNDTANQLEGIYRFPLPPEAQIERLALDVNGQMEDGAFVDRARASAIWRGVIRNAVHPMQQAQETQELVWVPGPWHDPALLEWQRGGRFELRIFPIPAHGERRVAISYTQLIEASGGVRRYVYPLAHDANGSTRVDTFDVDLQLVGNDTAAGVRTRGYALAPDAANAPAGATRMTFSQTAFVPAGDMVVEYALPDRNQQLTSWAYQPTAASPAVVVAATPTVGTAAAPTRATAPAAIPAAPGAPAAPVVAPDPRAFVAIALRPQLPRWSESRARDYAIIVDASRSMVGERLARAGRLARAMITEMDPRDRAVVLACDTSCREMPGGLQNASAAVAQAAQTFLGTEEAAGASDLVAQIREASRRVTVDPARDGRIVYLGDGLGTAGYRRADMVAAEVSEIVPTGRATVTAVALGSDADTQVLGAMARAGGGAIVPYVPGEALTVAAMGVLEATYGVTLRDPVLTLPSGLSDLAPARLPTMRSGSETIVVARMATPEVTGEAVLRGTVAGEPFEARFPVTIRSTTSAGNAFVPRLYAATRIADLESHDGDRARDEIVQLSQSYRVASRYTSLLVLESDAMYRAFGVRRNEAGGGEWTGEATSDATVAGTIGAREQQVLTAALGANDPNLGGAFSQLAANGPAEERNRRANAPSADRAAAGRGDSEGDSDTADVGRGDDDTIGTGGAVTGTTTSMNSGSAGMPMGHASAARMATGGTMSSSVAALEPSAITARSERAPAPTTPAQQPAATPTPMAGGLARGRAGASSAPAGMEMAVDDIRGMRRPGPGRGFGGGGQWMRRVWVRHAAIAAMSPGASSEHSRVDAARLALLASPDSRNRHDALYRALSIAGQFDEAADVATRWSSRDALDADAIVRLSDMAARRGDQVRAIRLLGGTVDVRPDDVNYLRRMIGLHDRAAETAIACVYRVALAQSRPADEAALIDAVRCERAQGRTASAGRILAAIADATVRQRVDTASATVAPMTATVVRGDVTAEATWDTATDLDVAVIDPRGQRVSWMGGRQNVTARGAHDVRSEAVGLGRAGTGEYVIEVSRAQGSDMRTVRGRVEISSIGEHRSMSFTLPPGTNTVRVGSVSITREAQMVPVNNW